MTNLQAHLDTNFRAFSLKFTPALYMTLFVCACLCMCLCMRMYIFERFQM